MVENISIIMCSDNRPAKAGRSIFIFQKKKNQAATLSFKVYFCVTGKKMVRERER